MVLTTLNGPCLFPWDKDYASIFISPFDFFFGSFTLLSNITFDDIYSGKLMACLIHYFLQGSLVSQVKILCLELFFSSRLPKESSSRICSSGTYAFIFLLIFLRKLRPQKTLETD